MKYFTAEIWKGWQGDDATFNRAQKKWQTNVATYRRKLRRLAPRLGTRANKFFSNHSLHDGRLLLYAVSDWPRSNLQTKQWISKTSVRIDVLAGCKRAIIYQLLYNGVHEIVIHTRNDLFGLENSRFGDWGYDELLAEGRRLFRHNILFQTGTEISIVFQRFGFRSSKASPAALKNYPDLRA